MANVATFEVLVHHGDVEVARASGSASAPLEVPELEWQQGLTIYVAGLGSDGVLQAHGSAAPELPKSPEPCCIRLCFCSEDLHRSAACGCGSNTCSATCD